MTWTARAVRNRGELEQILKLQRENLASALGDEEARAQGFVTVEHTLAGLEAMHAFAPSIVVEAGSELAGYALTMTLEARECAPVLRPMFDLLETLRFRDEPLAERAFYVMGQICVARAYRGQGVFAELYRGHRREYGARYELVVTEIAARNTRSLRAHERVGFERVHRYGEGDDEWIIVAWDWSRAA